MRSERTGVLLALWISLLLSVVHGLPEVVWWRTFGGSASEGGMDLVECPDGGVVLVGHTESYGAGLADIYVVKIDSNGNKVWERTFGGFNDDWGDCVLVASDGSTIVAGSSSSSGGDSDFYLLKISPDGNGLWDRVVDMGHDDNPRSLVERPNGGFIMAGETSPSLGYDDGVLLAFGGDGQLEWNRTFGGDKEDTLTSIVPAGSGGGYLAAGVTDSYGQIEGFLDHNVYLVRVDDGGALIWQKALELEALYQFDPSRGILHVAGVGYILSGSLRVGYGSYQAGVLQINYEGEQIALRGYARGAANSIVRSGDGGYVLVGSSGTNLYIFRTDGEGNGVWQKGYSGKGEAWGRAAIKAKDGSYVILGETRSYSSNPTDMLVMKIVDTPYEPVSETWIAVPLLAILLHFCNSGLCTGVFVRVQQGRYARTLPDRS